MTKLTIEEAYEKGRSIGRGEGHSNPSPETRERLKALEVNQTNLMQEIQEIKQMIEKLGLKLDCALDKKADKWVQSLVTWFLYIVAAGFLGVLGTLIYQAIVHFEK
jgi:hypothetical protein